MKHVLWFALLMTVTLMWAAGCTNKRAENVPAASSGAHEDPEGYYTCPMHPEVHEHKPGACPICGMALVKVEQKPKSAANEEIFVTDRQLSLAGIGRHTVEKKDLAFSLAVSGRLISPREVVFQIYESDLQLVKAGLKFRGSASASPGETLEGQIRRVDNLIDPSSRTVRALGVLNRAPKIMITDGGFHGEILASEKAQIAVPEDAVLHAGTRDLVYLISKENGLKPVAVKLGRKSSGEYQVLSGLNEGDVISTGPNFLIDSEAKIRGSSDQTHH